MTKSELNRLIQAYQHVVAAIQDADIPDDVLETIPRDRRDAVVTAQDALMVARRNLARVIWAYRGYGTLPVRLSHDEIEKLKGMAND